VARADAREERRALERRLMRPEARLLLLAGRASFGELEREAATTLMVSGLDWDLVLSLAARHGMVPLLHRHLGHAEADLPRKVLASLWAQAESIARRSSALACELVEVVGLLESRGVAVIPYKGPVLAEALYGNVALREFTDLDLLVRARDAWRAKSVLAERGYAPPFALPPHLESALVSSPRHDELPLVDAARGFVVELHWRTDPDSDVIALEEPQTWRSLEPCQVAGVTMACLPARELLLVLCLHGTKHLWSRLAWLVDVAELLRRDDAVDGQWLLARAQALRCVRRLALGLRLARDLLDAPVPATLRPAIEDGRVASIAANLKASLFEREYRAPGTLAYIRALSRLQDSPSRQARYLARAALTPTLGDWLSHPLPSHLSFLYLPLRVPRLARKYLRKSA